MRVFVFLFILGACLGCSRNSETQTLSSGQGIQFNSSNADLVEAFTWAKSKALSFAHDGSDPVGLWYEAALPNREAFCMRDVSHQAIGAELLGLGEHNLNMMRKFAHNISTDKDFCSYWEINRYDLPAPVDFENDKDFWYNLPANFDVIYNIDRLYKWTGNEVYITHPELLSFYDLSMNQYVDHWQLRGSKVNTRDRNLHVKEGPSRFGNRRGIPTYNEGGRGETFFGVDQTASLIAAYFAYSRILESSGDSVKSRLYAARGRAEQQFLESFWWDDSRNDYRSIMYSDSTYDYFMVGDNQAFLHYLLYFDALTEQGRKSKVVKDYVANYKSLIVELKSYLPVLFYEYGFSKEANEMIVDLCSKDNHRRDYPENSFTIIEHIVRGLMGVDANSRRTEVTTSPRLPDDQDWALLSGVPVMNSHISIKHIGNTSTTLTVESGDPLTWHAQLPGYHEVLYLDDQQVKCSHGIENNTSYSYYSVSVKKGESRTVRTDP